MSVGSGAQARLGRTSDPLAARRPAGHGYDLSKLIHARSGGTLTFHIDSLYPLLYRLEDRGWIKGSWIEKAGERRRRFYKLTGDGRRVLAAQRKTWEAFVEAVRRVTADEPA